MTSSKKILINSIIYIVLGFLSPAINFILIPIYSNHLSSSDYALIAQSALIQSVFGNILGIGVNGAFNRYFYESYKDPTQLQKLYSTSIISIVASSLSIMLLFSLIGSWFFKIIFKNDVFTYWEYGLFSITIAFLSIIQTLTLSYFRNSENAKKFAFWSIAYFLFAALCIYIGVVILDLKAKGSIYGRLIGLAVPVVLYICIYYHKNKIYFIKSINNKLIIFGLPLVPYLFLNSFLGQADKYAVERFFNLELLGLYSFGFLISSVNEIFINALASALNPQIFKYLQEGNTAYDKNVLALYRVYILLGILFNIGITVLGTFGILLFINDSFKEVAYFFPLLSVAYLFRIFYNVYTVNIIYHKKSNFLPVINIITLIFTVLFLIGLINFAGLIGVCIARIIIQAIQMLTTVVMLKNKKLYQENHYSFFYEYATTAIILIYVTLWYILIPAKPTLTHYSYLGILLALVISLLGVRIYRLYVENKHLFLKRL